MSKAKIGDKISALVLDHIRTFQVLQRLLGVFIAECRGALVIGFRGSAILWATAAFLRERTHAFERTGMILRRRLLEQAARRRVVLGPADAVGQHQTELILRF